ncbi:hypothetical protein BC827DRAFT_57497 [Russula dissimulans]|nr:hypothetical protein BC827DRAFT_57497 [Russula dissimulans]
MSTIYVPVGFAWIAASVLSVAAVLQWQTTVVGGARKRARIPYPQAYADKTEQEASKEAMVFNCAQRAHQNTLENVPVIVLTTLIGGLHYPIPAAAGCALWSLARIIYTVRYTTGEPRKVFCFVQ